MINHNARATIDAALESGGLRPVGLEIGTSQMYWSASMFEILGFRDRGGPRHLRRAAAAAPPGRRLSRRHRRAHRPRPAQCRRLPVPHAPCRRPLDLAARPRPRPDARRHRPSRFVGIVVDITEQLDLAARNAAADHRIREAIETISEAFVVCDDEDRIVVCNSKFRELNGPERGRGPPGGARYDEILAAPAAARRSRRAVSSPSAAPARATSEMELADGRWLQISERRTHCGGFVSVGTDITALKRHETQLTRANSAFAPASPSSSRASTRWRSRPSSSPNWPRNIPTRRPRRGGSEPRQVGIPRQYEPRAAHPAQRHHRLLRGDEGGAFRTARRAEIWRVRQGHPRQRTLSPLAHRRHPRYGPHRGRPDAAGNDGRPPRRDAGRDHARRLEDGGRTRRSSSRRRCRPAWTSSPTGAR